MSSRGTGQWNVCYGLLNLLGLHARFCCTVLSSQVGDVYFSLICPLNRELKPRILFGPAPSDYGTMNVHPPHFATSISPNIQQLNIFMLLVFFCMS
jgi:hypothetical protein